MGQSRLPIAEPKPDLKSGRWPLSRWIFWLGLMAATGLWSMMILTA